jgi:hypothetical protein
MKKGKSGSVDAPIACCLEVSGLASAILTDDKELIEVATCWGVGGGRSVQVSCC